MRWLARWVRRHRLLSVLGLMLAGAGTTWLCARGGSPAPPASVQRPAPPVGEGVVQGDYPGSAKPLADGSAPSPQYTFKGKVASMLCHDESSPYYQRTRADVWFRSEQEAVAAGFRVWRRRR